MDEVAHSLGVSWPTAQHVFDAQAAATAREPAATPVLGIDETRRERARWVRGPDGGWRRRDPWETGFVDLTTGKGLLGQVPRRTSRYVIDWLENHSEQWQAGTQFVALDPSAPYPATVRQALPSTTILVDGFQLVELANQMTTKARHRVTQKTQGGDPVWANQQLLLRGRQRLSDRAFTRLWNGVVDHDPSGELLAAWIAKQERRGLLSRTARSSNHGDIAHYQDRFSSWCASTDASEVTTLAETIDRW